MANLECLERLLEPEFVTNSKELGSTLLAGLRKRKLVHEDEAYNHTTGKYVDRSHWPAGWQRQQCKPTLCPRSG